jgi:hypothetical protein
MMKLVTISLQDTMCSRNGGDRITRRLSEPAKTRSADLRVRHMESNLVLKSCVAALLLAMVVCASRSEAASDKPPEALVRLGQRVGCPILSKPPGTPWGVVTVWIAEQQTGTVYAAWCVRESQEGIVHDLLVTTTARQHPWAQCTPHIRLGMNAPFPQLRATMLPRDLPYPKTLADFWYLGKDWLEDGELVGGSEIPSGPALDIGLGGAGQMLMCRRGRWIMGGYH